MPSIFLSSNGRDRISPNIDKFLQNRANEPITNLRISYSFVLSISTEYFGSVSSQLCGRDNCKKLYHLKLLIRKNYSKVLLKKSKIIIV